MKADKKKLELIMARKCMNTGDLLAVAKMPRPTFSKVLRGENVSTRTIGLVAEALKVDVTEIIK